MRRFHLERKVDETGVSGTGRVAEGVVFATGWCAMVWLTAHTSCAFYTSIDEVRAIHGHGGKTSVVFDDCAYCPHPSDDHWMDNCGGCANAGCQCTASGWPPLLRRELVAPCDPAKPCWFVTGMNEENYCSAHKPEDPNG